MSNYFLMMELLSDTTFGRGDGVAGLLDQEVEHDSYGFPYLRGRTLKGLLSEECENIIYTLPDKDRWYSTLDQLFGVDGSGIGTIAQMHIGDACLSQKLRSVVEMQIGKDKDKDSRKTSKITSTDILSSLTTIRRQTAIDPVDGVADDRSLRSSRVILRERCFFATLTFDVNPTPDMLALLTVGILALRRVGSSRNRGRGHVRCLLNDEKLTQEHFQYFQRETNK
jgi:hypothetical protein